MHCPTCNETLVMADRNGVEIDYCPKCRGVWLDRGELDKIIERAAGAPAPSAAPVREAVTRDSDDDDHYDKGRKPYRKRESFLSELFDF
jgi:Zn-finger nucleic acid-binding protein